MREIPIKLQAVIVINPHESPASYEIPLFSETLWFSENAWGIRNPTDMRASRSGQVDTCGYEPGTNVQSTFFSMIRFRISAKLLHSLHSTV